MRAIDMTGVVFSRLTVLSLAETGHRIRKWNCVCECGTSVMVDGSKLRNGHTRSCGCMQQERASHANTKPAGTCTYTTIRCSYIASARKRNLDWALDQETFMQLVQGACAYCGVPPFTESKPYRLTRNSAHNMASTIFYNGIDRVDNKAGYTNSNSVSCCKLCNYAKRNLTLEEFMAWVKRLVKHNKDS